MPASSDSNSDYDDTVSDSAKSESYDFDSDRRSETDVDPDSISVDDFYTTAHAILRTIVIEESASNMEGYEATIDLIKQLQPEQCIQLFNEPDIPENVLELLKKIFQKDCATIRKKLFSTILKKHTAIKDKPPPQAVSFWEHDK